MRRVSRHVVLLLGAVLALSACGSTPQAEPAPTPKPSAPSGKPAAASAPAGVRQSWPLVWADEFRGSALDRRRWTAEDNSTYGDGNAELACLTDRPANLKVSGGALHLIARREGTPFRCGRSDSRFPRGRAYTSAMVHTRDTASWTYGRFEVRARTATRAGVSKGLWSAAWMRPVDRGRGELDIVEALGHGPAGGSSLVHQALHDGIHKVQQYDYDLPAAGPAMSEAFHTYAMEWEPGEIRWFVDGRQTWVLDRGTTPRLADTFDTDFFLRLNLAVGGKWPGAPSAATLFPAEYVIDYVRVYARNGDG